MQQTNSTRQSLIEPPPSPSQVGIRPFQHLSEAVRGLGIQAILANFLLTLLPVASSPLRLDEVIKFTVVQLGLLPSYLRLPCLIGLQVFNGAALLRYGKAFTFLGRQQQRSYMNFWAASPLSDFIKLLRSNLLLAYYDLHQDS